MHKKIYSYDVFDTCLIRACGKSIFVFDILAKKVLGPNASISDIRDFSLIRIRGEKRAKEKLVNKEREDVTLDDIYTFCDFSLVTSESNESIKTKELEVESNILLPVNNIKEEIAALHHSGEHIIYISDMYLPSAFIKSILIRHNIYSKDDKIYVSGEVGKTKTTGNLYKYVCDVNGIKYSDLIHKGNDKHSDYKIPNKLGINSKLIKIPYTYYEKMAIAESYASPQMECIKAPSISRAIVESHPRSPYVLFSADFVAPIYVPFVYSIMKDAVKRGIEKLFFLARDGYIFYQIAKQFESEFPQIKLVYIYVSRTSLYLPGLNNISYESFAEFVADSNRKINIVLNYFKMDDFIYNEDDYKGVIGSALLRKLVSDKEFVKIITKRHKEERKLCLKYFSQEGLTNGRNAIIDSFGTRRCQKAINNILKSVGHHEVYGYYFDVVSYRIFEGKYSSSIFDENRLLLSTNSYLGVQGVFEQYFSITNQMRTIGYYFSEDKKILPVQEEAKTISIYVDNVFKSNLDCCTEYAKYFSYMQPMDTFSCQKNAMSVYTSFCYIPRPEYLKALEELEITSIGMKEKLLFRTNVIKVFLNRKRILWFYGNYIYNSGWLYLLCKCILFLFLKVKKKRQIDSI